MKLILGLLAACLLAIVLLVYIAKPIIPDVSGMPDYDAGIGCLREIPRKYNPHFFTFKAWVMSWYAHYADKWGIELSQSMLDFYKKYIDLRFDVDCYINSSNDAGLNMALSSIEFEAVYNVIAEQHDLQTIK